MVVYFTENLERPQDTHFKAVVWLVAQAHNPNMLENAVAEPLELGGQPVPGQPEQESKSLSQ